MTHRTHRGSPTQTIDTRDLKPPEEPPRAPLPFTRGDGASNAPSVPFAAPPPPMHSMRPASPPPPPMPAPHVGGEGARPAHLPSARAYSDAAADATPPGRAHRRTAKEREPLRRRALVEILAFEPGIGRRLRRRADLSDLLREHRRQRGAREALADDAPSAAERDEQDVLTIASFASGVSVRALRDAQEAALSDCDRLDAPLGVVRGKLTPTPNPATALQALASMAQSALQRDKRVQPLSTAIDDALGALGSGTTKTFERLSGQLDGWLSTLGFGQGHATETITRRMIEQRAFRRHLLLGEERLRAELEVEGTSFVAYLPAAAAPQWPLLPSLPVVAIVELRPREDASEAAHEALLVRAVARVLAG